MGCLKELDNYHVNDLVQAVKNRVDKSSTVMANESIKIIIDGVHYRYVTESGPATLLIVKNLQD